jgi:anti-sigma-K factor RskA
LQFDDGMKTHEQFADDLTQYVLEELTGPERQELEQHLDTCPACRREVQSLRSDLSLVGLSAAGPRPPARSKDRLMRAVAAEPRGISSLASVSGPRRGLSWALVPTLIAVGLLIWAGSLWQDNQALHHNMASLATLYQTTSAQLQQANERVHLLSAPDAVQVSLSPQAHQGMPHATAIYSPSMKRCMLVASNMAPAPPGKAYELWLIPMEGAPMPAGLFKPDEHGNAMMMDHAMPEGVVAKAFAVTLEDESGSDKPTSPILIVGSGL